MYVVCATMRQFAKILRQPFVCIRSAGWRAIVHRTCCRLSRGNEASTGVPSLSVQCSMCRDYGLGAWGSGCAINVTETFGRARDSAPQLSGYIDLRHGTFAISFNGINYWSLCCLHGSMLALPNGIDVFYRSTINVPLKRDEVLVYRFF